MDGLTVLLEGRPAGERVTFAEIRMRTPRRASTPRVAEVLAGRRLLVDDSTPAVHAWIERRTGELPDGFASAVRAWLLVLLDGDARTDPGHASASTSTSPPSSGSSAAGQHTAVISARSPQTTSGRSRSAARPPAPHRHSRSALVVPVRQETLSGLLADQPAEVSGEQHYT
jgi:hypothetical protein